MTRSNINIVCSSSDAKRSTKIKKEADCFLFYLFIIQNILYRTNAFYLFIIQNILYRTNAVFHLFSVKRVVPNMKIVFQLVFLDIP
jgi:hypothetical protein